MSRLKAFLAEQSLRLLTERPIDYGVQMVVSDGTSEIPVNIYTTGRIVVAGKDCPLRSRLQAWSAAHQSAKPSEPGRIESVHIGVDEAGKGDVFGPLVIAGAVVRPEQSTLLLSQGVRDSKTLTSSRIRDLADWLKPRCPAEVLLLTPADYNDRYREFGNLDRLLGWGHARVIEVLNERTGVDMALSDQFSEKQHIQKALAAAGVSVTLQERPHAENDLAVAAASILARAAFEQAFDELRRKSSLDLPSGASDPAIAEFLRIIHQRWGEEGLRRSAKLNFKPVKEILGS